MVLTQLYCVTHECHGSTAAVPAENTVSLTSAAIAAKSTVARFPAMISVRDCASRSVPFQMRRKRESTDSLIEFEYPPTPTGAFYSEGEGRREGMEGYGRARVLSG